MAGAVLIHGAWHGACGAGTGSSRSSKPRIPVVSIDLPLRGLADDVAAARRAMVASGPGTVVVGHSYGGEVISAAARGLPEVSHLIYLCALMFDTGRTSGA